MDASAMILTPAVDGWSIRLVNGLELEHFRGFLSKWRAQRRLAQLVAGARA